MIDLALSFSSNLEDEITNHGLRISNGDELCWPPNDPDHPRNWSLWRKIFDTTVIISLEFFTTMDSTSGAAAADVQTEFMTGEVLSIFAFTSIYLFGQGIGCIFFSPISESFGRKKLYVVSMFLYSAASLLVGTVPHVSAVVLGRLCAGILSAIPCIILAGSIEDMYDQEARVWMIFAWGVASNIGLTLGPIYSTYITQGIGWRWVFRIAAIVTFGQAVVTLFIKESRPTQILKKRLARLNRAYKTNFTIDNSDQFPSMYEFVKTSLTRPTTLFFTEPIVFLITILASVAFGQIYLLTEVLPNIYTQPPLSFTIEQASLSFLPITIGVILDVLPRFYDHNLLKRIKARNEIIKPEHKIRAFAIGAPLLAIGLWWFAWTIPPLAPTPWPISFLPLILVGFATNEFDCTLGGYLTDSYTIFSASAYASLAFWRAIVSGALPLFANQMYRNLGNNKATTILAVLATLFCVAPVLFLKYGERLREKSSFARFSREAEERSLGKGSVDSATSSTGVMDGNVRVVLNERVEGV